MYCQFEELDGVGKCGVCGYLYHGKYRWPVRTCGVFTPQKSVVILDTLQIGTTLHDLLYDRFGVDITQDCACKVWIARMNEGGPAWCRENLQKIVGKMLSEAKRRKWVLEGRPLLSKVARLGTMTPWGMEYARKWACELVLEAIELCEAGASDAKAD